MSGRYAQATITQRRPKAQVSDVTPRKIRRRYWLGPADAGRRGPGVRNPDGNGHAAGESVPAAVTSGASQAGVSGAASPETDETDSADGGGHDQLGQ
jgi:hypothetical protein